MKSAKILALLAAVTIPAAALPGTALAQDALASSASAQRQEPTAAPADGCELHVWPAERMSSQTSGLLGPGLLNSAINGKRDSSNQALMASALDSPSQLNALTSLDLRTLLARSPGTTIVLHQTPIVRNSMNKVKTRRSDSTAQCYSELIVADVFYQKAMLYGRSLRTLFMLRDFGNDQKIDKEYKAWGGNGLSLFPPKEGDDAVAALDELVGVFKRNFEEYAGNARKSLGTKAL